MKRTRLGTILAAAVVVAVLAVVVVLAVVWGALVAHVIITQACSMPSVLRWLEVGLIIIIPFVELWLLGD